MVNSYLLFRKSLAIQNKKKLSHYKFRLGVIKNLIKPFYQMKRKSNDLFVFDETKNDFCLKNKFNKCELDNC